MRTTAEARNQRIRDTAAVSCHAAVAERAIFRFRELTLSLVAPQIECSLQSQEIPST
jgi:hypothetical protein